MRAWPIIFTRTRIYRLGCMLSLRGAYGIHSCYISHHHAWLSFDLRVRLKIIGSLETMHGSDLPTVLIISFPIIFKRTVHIFLYRACALDYDLHTHTAIPAISEPSENMLRSMHVRASRLHHVCHLRVILIYMDSGLRYTCKKSWPATKSRRGRSVTKGPQLYGACAHQNM